MNLEIEEISQFVDQSIDVQSLLIIFILHLQKDLEQTFLKEISVKA